MYQERKQFINSVNRFINSSKSRLNDVLEKLDWSKESVYSALHKTEVQSLKNNSRDRSKSDKFINSATDGTEFLDEGHFNKLESFSARLEPLYTDLVASLNQTPSNVKQDQNKTRTEILAEMLKLERDSKRRRTNYKNRVHTKNKSHLEILREVLAEQMSTLSDTHKLENNTSVALKETMDEKVESELVEIKFPGGNPHTAWKTVLDQISQERRVRKDSRDRDRTYTRDKYSSRTKYKDYSEHRKDDRREKYNDRSHKKYDTSKCAEYESDRSYHDDRHNTDKYSRIHTSDKNYSRYEVRDGKNYKKSTSPKLSDKSYQYEDDNYSAVDKDGSHEDYYRKENKYKKKKHKRDRSSSASPSRHKSKKHKSKHRSHL